MPSIPATLNREAGGRFLADPGIDALTAVVAACAFLQDDLLDEDHQPYLPDELRLMLEAEHLDIPSEVLTKICGLLFAVSGDEFLDSVVHFRRFVASTVEGQVFSYDDEIDPGGEDEPSLSDVFWALYQADLLVADDLTDSLGPKIGQYINLLGQEEAHDAPGLAQSLAEEPDDLQQMEDYTRANLVFRRRRLAANLRELGCKPEWIADLDPELAQDFDQ